MYQSYVLFFQFYGQFQSELAFKSYIVLTSMSSDVLTETSILSALRYKQEWRRTLINGVLLHSFLFGCYVNYGWAFSSFSRGCAICCLLNKTIAPTAPVARKKTQERVPWTSEWTKQSTQTASNNNEDITQTTYINTLLSLFFISTKTCCTH